MAKKISKCGRCKKPVPKIDLIQVEDEEVCSDCFDDIPRGEQSFSDRLEEGFEIIGSDGDY